MRLVDKGNTRVIVRNRVSTTGKYGRTTELGPGTVRAVTLQPVTLSEAEAIPTATIKVIASGTWPGDANCEVEVVDGHYAGHWDQVGPTRYYNNSPRTAHYTVMLRSRGVAIKE